MIEKFKSEIKIAISIVVGMFVSRFTVMPIYEYNKELFSSGVAIGTVVLGIMFNIGICYYLINLFTQAE